MSCALKIERALRDILRDILVSETKRKRRLATVGAGESTPDSRFSDKERAAFTKPGDATSMTLGRSGDVDHGRNGGGVDDLGVRYSSYAGADAGAADEVIADGGSRTFPGYGSDGGNSSDGSSNDNESHNRDEGGIRDSDGSSRAEAGSDPQHPPPQPRTSKGASIATAKISASQSGSSSSSSLAQDTQASLAAPGVSTKTSVERRTVSFSNSVVKRSEARSAEQAPEPSSFKSVTMPERIRGSFPDSSMQQPYVDSKGVREESGRVSGTKRPSRKGSAPMSLPGRIVLDGCCLLLRVFRFGAALVVWMLEANVVWTPLGDEM